MRDGAACVAALRAVRPEVVFHLAALTNPGEAEARPELAWSVNVGGTRSLLQAVAAEAPGARVVVVSSCHAYGPPTCLPVREDHPLRPVGVYARSKAEAEREACALAERLGLDVVRARPFNLVGPGQRPPYAAAAWASCALAGQGSVPTGDLTLVRDLLDVRDAASGLQVLAARGSAGEAYNLCSGVGVPLSTLFALAAPGAVAEVDPARLRPDDVPTLVGDPGRALALGWQPTIPLARSVEDLRAALATG